MTDTTYFIYLHRRNDTGDVFYVGKGTRTKKKQYERAYVIKKRGAFWNSIVSKAGYTVELVADFFVESDAFAMERDLIAFYGRRVDGGTLCNLTAGGDGHAGLSPSQETRAKLRAAVAGPLHPNWGKALSAETCKKKSESLKNSPLSLRGKKLPDWWKQRIAATKVGAKNPMYGKTGAAHPNSRRVIDKATGAEYPSVTAAARAAGLSMQGLHNMLTGHRINTTAMELV